MASVSTTGHFAAEHGGRSLRRLNRQIGRTVRSGEPAEVHKLRVAIRRFARILVVLKPWLPADESRRMRRKLKKIMEQAGNVRDRDVALHLLAERGVLESDPLVCGLNAERAEAGKALTDLLGRWARRGLSVAWRSAMETGVEDSSPAVETTAQRMLSRMAKEHFRSGHEAAGEGASAEEIHRFRIAAKKLRYTLELFAPLYGASLDSLLKQLKALQSLLGDINDCAATGRLLSGHGASHEILNELKKKQRKKIAEFREYWSESFSGESALREWVRILRKTETRKPPARISPAETRRAISTLTA